MVGLGADTFVFDKLETSLMKDTINDFGLGTDRIAIDHTAFTGLALVAAGPIHGDELGLGAAATTASQRLIYNAANGALFYDANRASAEWRLPTRAAVRQLAHGRRLCPTIRRSLLSAIDQHKAFNRESLNVWFCQNLPSTEFGPAGLQRALFTVVPALSGHAQDLPFDKAMSRKSLRASCTAWLRQSCHYRAHTGTR